MGTFTFNKELDLKPRSERKLANRPVKYLKQAGEKRMSPAQHRTHYFIILSNLLDYPK